MKPLLLVLFLATSSFSLANFSETYSDILKDGNNGCSYYAYAETVANPGFLGSVSNSITGMGYGKKNGQYVTSYNGKSVTFKNETPTRTFTHGYPMSANVAHSYATALGGSDREVQYPYVYADCDNSGGGSSPSCEGTPSDGNGWNHDPYNEDPCDSPILIDTRNQNIQCGGRDQAIFFDLWATGEPLLINWVAPGNDDVFLVHDINSNGIVDDGSELFGSGTYLVLEDRLALNGFLGLAQFDNPQLGGNQDAFIGPEDLVWNDLYLWNDQNADGYTDPGELFELEHEGFTRLDTIPKERRVFDEHGNWFRYWATAFGAQNRLMIDVFFVRH